LPDFQPFDAFAARIDKAHDLVPRHDREVRRYFTVNHMKVGPAYAAGQHAQAHFPFPRLGQRALRAPQGLANPIKLHHGSG
jgi:hypothetical protein